MPILNDRFFDYPDTRKLQYPEPVLLHIAAMSYCERINSIGLLKRSDLKFVYELMGTGRWHISRKKAVKRLVDIGWWIESDSGYFIPPTELYKYCRHVVGKQNPTRKKFNSIRKLAWEYLTNKYGVICANCGSTDNLQIDHIKPIARGGTNNFDNLQILCRSCNCRKSDRYEE